MSAALESLKTALAIPAETEITEDSHLLVDLRLTEDALLSMLEQRFSLLLGIDNNDEGRKQDFLRIGIDHTPSAASAAADVANNIDFGAGWTVRRLMAVMERCEENSWPTTAATDGRTVTASIFDGLAA